LLKNIGQDLCKSLLLYYNKEFLKYNLFGELTEKYEPYLTGELDNEKMEIIKYVEENFLDLKKEEEKDIKTDNDSDGSDSEPSVDNLDLEDLKKLLPTKSKNKSIYLYLYFEEKIKKKKPSFNYLKEKKSDKVESQKNVPVVVEKKITPIIPSKSIERKPTMKTPVVVEPKKDENKFKIDVDTQTEEIFFKLYFH